jgi:hypothetical protein
VVDGQWVSGSLLTWNHSWEALTFHLLLLLVDLVGLRFSLLTFSQSFFNGERFSYEI